MLNRINNALATAAEAAIKVRDEIVADNALARDALMEAHVTYFAAMKEAKDLREKAEAMEDTAAAKFADAVRKVGASMTQLGDRLAAE